MRPQLAALPLLRSACLQPGAGVACSILALSNRLVPDDRWEASNPLLAKDLAQGRNWLD